jgi:hypothetical protein
LLFGLPPRFSKSVEFVDQTFGMNLMLSST